MKKGNYPYKKILFNGIFIDEHRAVAIQHWGEDAVKGMDVHHKNGDTRDNRIENLELLPHPEHVRRHSKGRKYSTEQRNAMKRSSRKYWNTHFSRLSRRVIQETLDGIPIVGYESSYATASYGFDDTAVNKCCVGRLKTYHNFRWRFLGDDEHIEVPFLKRLPKRVY